MLQNAFALIWLLARMAFIKSAVNNIEMQLYVNEMVQYGEQVSVVVTLSMLPNYNLTLRVSTPTYLLGYWTVAPPSVAMNPRFTYTNDIMKELRRLDIEPNEPITKKDVYFVVLNATFWENSNQTLTLTGFIDTLLPTPNTKTVEIMVNSSLTCLPRMYPTKGTSPDKPLQILAGRSNLVDVKFEESCGERNMDLTWILMDLLGTTNLRNLSHRGFEYYVQPYSIRYPTEHELWRNLYMIQISALFKNTTYLARSYLKVAQENVYAEILGGHFRMVAQNEKFTIDGTRSRDYSRAPDEKQFKKYYWECKSLSDKYNKNCWKKTWEDGKIHFRPYAFKEHKHYTFTLKVQSDFNPNVKAEKKQLLYILSAVQVQSLTVTILCLANCENDYYNEDSKVLLLAQSTYNKGLSIRYLWTLDHQIAGDDRKLNLFMRTEANFVLVNVIVKTGDGRRAGASKQLHKIQPPTGGYCSIYPEEGIEATTEFYVCCPKFKTLNGPIQFFYYAGEVLLTDCMDCTCPVYLSREVKFVKILICNHMLACTSRYVGVEVNPLAITDNEKFEDDVYDFLSAPPHNIAYLVDQNENLQLLAKLQWAASHINQGPTGLDFVTMYSLFHTQSLTELSKVTNLTYSFAQQLTPITTEELVVLIHSVRKMNSNFQHVIDNGMESFIVQVPYYDVINACVRVYHLMRHLTKQIPRPPQSLYDKYTTANKKEYLNDIYVDELFNEISTYKIVEAQERSTIWLNAMWETERLFRFLYLARQLGLMLDYNGTSSAGVSLQVQCFELKRKEDIHIRTSDQMHEVTFTPKLLDEMKDPDYDTICIKVISTIRELNWWYPEEKQPSSVLLSVRIYAKEDDLQEERALMHSKISFKTVIGKYKPAIEYPNMAQIYTEPRSQMVHDTLRGIEGDSDDQNLNEAEADPDIGDDDEDDAESVAETGKYWNCLRYGELKTEQQVLVYRINLDEHSMVVVRFMGSTHKLRILLVVNKLPKRLRAAISESQCIVPAHSMNTTMLLRNNCMTLQRVYMAVQLYKDKHGSKENLVLDHPAAFSFVFQVRTCDFWSSSKPVDTQCWDHQDCLPGLNNPEKGTIYCTCSKLGTYTSYVFHVPAVLVPMADYVPVEFNWALGPIYSIILTLLFIMLIYLFMKHNKLFSKTITCDMTGLDRSDKEVHDLLVYIRTGGQENAGTTATVRLIFQTQRRTELLFTLMQDPEKPELKRNSTYILWLRTRDIRIPTRIAVSHNSFGRYPSWFLRRIDIVDIQAQLMQIFHVRRWVRYKYLILSSALVIRPGDTNISAQSWRGRFNNELERQWINWGLWQPLTGSWRSGAIYDNLTRAQRVCIFTNKMLVAFCVCACVIGETTSETAYEDRKLSIDVSNLLTMAGISILLTNLVQYLLIKLINARL